MRRRYFKRGLARAAAALCIIPALSMAGAYAHESGAAGSAGLPEILPGNSASLTFKAANAEEFETDPELGEARIRVNVYKVAEIRADGNFVPLAFYEGVKFGKAGNDASAQIDETRAVADRIENPGEGQNAPAPAATVVFCVDGDGVQAEGITGTGMYLVWPEELNTTAYSYKFMSYLISLPSWNGEAGIWEYDVVSFLKMEQDLREGAPGGGTKGNAYQDTMTQSRPNFAVEENTAAQKMVKKITPGRKIVRTGDQSGLIIWSAAALGSGAVLSLLAFLNRRKNRRTET